MLFLSRPRRRQHERWQPGGLSVTYRGSVRQFLAIARSFRAVCRKRGLVRTLHLGMRDLLFDLWNATETSIEIGSGAVAPRSRYERHEACNPLIFVELLRHVRLDLRTSTFLDVGAGKGRALLLAARHGFGKVIGVELSPELCAVAQRNITGYRRRHPGSCIELHCADAAGFDVPVEVNVAFLFNPFGPDVMLAVLDRVAESIGRCSRDFYIVYLNPRHEDLLVGAGFLPVYRQGADGLILRRHR
jgi:SAM-dependent methyltransferase